MIYDKRKRITFRLCEYPAYENGVTKIVTLFLHILN